MRTLRYTAAALVLTVAGGCAVTYPGQIDAISAGDALNQVTADSAPQQSVVNGWTARDYLELAARQNTELSVLLYVAVAVLVVIALMLFAQNRRLARVEDQLVARAAYGPPTAQGTND